MNDEVKATVIRETEDGWEISVRLLKPSLIEINVQPEPEPVPEWRRLVDAADGDPDCPPLASVLDHLTTLTFEDLSAEGRKAALARIVAVCETQVGDGWQADPDTVYHARSPHRCDVKCLIDALASAQPWRVVGNRAAAWLRYLTEADA